MKDKLNRNGIKVLPTASDIGDMMADKQRHEERSGTRIEDYLEEDDYGHKTYRGRR